MTTYVQWLPSTLYRGQMISTSGLAPLPCGCVQPCSSKIPVILLGWHKSENRGLIVQPVLQQSVRCQKTSSHRARDYTVPKSPSEINSRREDIAELVAQAYTDSKFADFQIVCKDKVWDVHRLVISWRSEYFAKACELSFEEGVSKKSEIHEDEPDIIDAVLRFMYTGLLSVPVNFEASSTREAKSQPEDDDMDLDTSSSPRAAMSFRSHEGQEDGDDAHSESGTLLFDSRPSGYFVDDLQDDEDDSGDYEPNDEEDDRRSFVTDGEEADRWIEAADVENSYWVAGSHLEQNIDEDPVTMAEGDINEDLLLDGALHMEQTKRLYSIVKLYAAADKCMVAKMKPAVIEEFDDAFTEEYVSTSPGAALHIGCEIHLTTPSEDRGLRNVCQEMLGYQLQQIMLNKADVLTKCLQKVPELGLDLMKFMLP